MWKHENNSLNCISLKVLAQSASIDGEQHLFALAQLAYIVQDALCTISLLDLLFVLVATCDYVIGITILDK
jgi:hypothetical protein